LAAPRHRRPPFPETRDLLKGIGYLEHTQVVLEKAKAEARGLFCSWAVRELGYNMLEIAARLEMSQFMPLGLLLMRRPGLYRILSGATVSISVSKVESVVIIPVFDIFSCQILQLHLAEEAVDKSHL
jgi:hypothetical protein